MKPFLDLNIFCSLKRNKDFTNFSTNVFMLISNPDLNHWLNQLLDQLQVNETPVIQGNISPHAYLSGRIYIGSNTTIEAGAYIKGPTYIGENSEIRHGAYVRGSSYIGNNCVVGHATEVKESCFMDGAKAGHFAYVGNSLLGQHSNLGAGTKLANLKLNKNIIKYKDPKTSQIQSSELKKFGAVIGDFCQTGCNSVLSPGSLMLPKTTIQPCQHYHGTLHT